MDGVHAYHMSKGVFFVFSKISSRSQKRRLQLSALTDRKIGSGSGATHTMAAPAPQHWNQVSSIKDSAGRMLHMLRLILLLA